MGRPGFQRREKDFKQGTILREWPLGARPAATLAGDIRYGWDGRHKNYRAPNGEWKLSTNREGQRTHCARYDPKKDFPAIAGALRAAMEAECADEEFREGYPSRLWAYVNDQLHEARLTNRGSGEYHAFPLEYESQYPTNPDLLSKAPRVSIP